MMNIWAFCKHMRSFGAGVVLAVGLGHPTIAQDLQALARVDMAKSGIVDAKGGGISLTLELSQPVPYRVFTLADPPRLVLDFKEIDWTGFNGAQIDRSEWVNGLRYGIFRPGWSRLVVDLNQPFLPESAELRLDDTRGTARLQVNLSASDAVEFARHSQVREEDGWALPAPSAIGTPKLRQLGDRPLIVVLDPGHGGVDSGAERDGYEEKHLVLQFARELKEALIRSGRYKAELSREGDVFLSLPDRISKARALGADVFLSIHADALSEGSATGTTVYTLSEKASSNMAQELAIGHDRSDLLAGVDLAQQDDVIATVLMDMARLETDQRSDLLAEFLVSGIAQSVGVIRKRPHLSAGFTVLKAPDIPSVLVELGFMSNKSDLNNLLTPKWRQQAIDGIVLALDQWTVEDAAQARLLRQ